VSRDVTVEIVDETHSISTDLARAVETAELAVGGTQATIRHDPRLREVDYGAWNGESVALIEQQRRREGWEFHA
jgi:broad specificity phosphatase PhoE